MLYSSPVGTRAVANFEHATVAARARKPGTPYPWPVRVPVYLSRGRYDVDPRLRCAGSSGRRAGPRRRPAAGLALPHGPPPRVGKREGPRRVVPGQLRRTGP